jgi:hypothetical protein
MTRPFFSVAWAASQRIYDPVNSGAKVAQIVAGYVEKNINNPSSAGVIPVPFELVIF